MGQLLKLTNARIEKPRPKSAGISEKTYYCTRCGAERFLLKASGSIHCAPCGAWMRNIEFTIKQRSNPMEG